MSKAVENEFKFTTDQKLGAADTVNALESFLREHGVPFNKKGRQSTDTYYDSEDLALFHGGCILRQKNSSNGRIKLTAKKPISNEEEMMSREEIEILSDGRFESLEAFGRECFPDLVIQKEPVLTIETERTAIYYIDGTDIMLSFDICRYVSGEDSKRFLEIEIESMGNATERGFDLIGMRDFVKGLSFFPVTKSKYQRGIEWIQSLNVHI
jgi:adenylate cyclase class IV